MLYNHTNKFYFYLNIYRTFKKYFFILLSLKTTKNYTQESRISLIKLIGKKNRDKFYLFHSRFSRNLPQIVSKNSCDFQINFFFAFFRCYFLKYIFSGGKTSRALLTRIVRPSLKKIRTKLNRRFKRLKCMDGKILKIIQNIIKNEGVFRKTVRSYLNFSIEKFRFEFFSESFQLV
jgi:hypothetical protein